MIDTKCVSMRKQTCIGRGPALEAPVFREKVPAFPFPLTPMWIVRLALRPPPTLLW